MASESKKPSLTGHSASHTYTVQTQARKSRNTHVPPHATRLQRASSGCAAGRKPRLGVSPTSFSFSSAQTTKAACSHETIHFEAPLLEGQVSKFSSVTQTRHQHAKHARTSNLFTMRGERIQDQEEHSKIV